MSSPNIPSIVKSLIKSILPLVAISAMSSVALADSYNQNIVAIFGGGNPDTGWTTQDSLFGGIELGLRAKNRDNGDTSNVNGLYSFASATASNPARALFNYEFSINSGGLALSAYDFYLAADTDASQGVSFQTVNALTYWGDSSYGTSSTANGAGVEGTAAALAGSNSIAQASQNISFGDYPGGAALALVPDATYNYQLYAVLKGTGADGFRLATVDITVQVGAGGAPAPVSVPDSGASLGLLGLGMAGLVLFNMKKKAAVLA